MKQTDCTDEAKTSPSCVCVCVCVCLCVGVGGGGTGGKRGTGLKWGRSYIFASFRLLILLSLYCRYQEEIVRLRTLLGNTTPAAHSRR